MNRRSFLKLASLLGLSAAALELPVPGPKAIVPKHPRDLSVVGLWQEFETVKDEYGFDAAIISQGVSFAAISNRTDKFFSPWQVVELDRTPSGPVMGVIRHIREDGVWDRGDGYCRSFSQWIEGEIIQPIQERI
jgi:hypothetical protein